MRKEGVLTVLFTMLISNAVFARPSFTQDDDKTVSGKEPLSEAASAIANARTKAGAALEISKTIESAEKALKASSEAQEAASAAERVSKTATATQQDAKTAADKAATTARAAALAASAAANAAVEAVDKISVDAAKSKAALAALNASKSARGAAEAATSAESAAAQAALPATPQQAQAAAGRASTQAAGAARHSAAAATSASEVAIQAETPDLPVTDKDDEGVLTALRARITGGAIFFNGRPEIVLSEDKTKAGIRSSQFSQSAIYLAIETQPRVFAFDGFGRCSKPKTKVDCQRESGVKFAERGNFHRWYVDPFVNVRLTTIPVSTGASEGIQAPSSDAFLQSQKAAQVQFGLVASYNFGHFELDGAAFHWGVGPIFRYMYQNATDPQRATRMWDVDDDLYDAETIGGRVTLYHKRATTWSPTAYFDVSWGKFQNFDTATGLTDAARACLSNPPVCLATGIPPENEFSIQKGWPRTYIEGRMFLKYLYLGFDINNGNGTDDLRFIGGVTVGLDQFFRRQ